MKENGNEAQLVELARQGDGEAFRQLVEAHGRRLFALAYRLTGDAANAEEVVQETFIKAHRGLRRFDSRARFGTWLHRIAVNCSMDMMRKQQRREARAPFDSFRDSDGAAPSTEPGPERRAFSAEIGRRVEEVLATLSPMERTAFVLRHFHGYSTNEIASELGVKPNASKHAVFRAVQKLRVALAPAVRGNHEAAC